MFRKLFGIKKKSEPEASVLVSPISPNVNTSEEKKTIKLHYSAPETLEDGKYRKKKSFFDISILDGDNEAAYLLAKTWTPTELSSDTNGNIFHEGKKLGRIGGTYYIELIAKSEAANLPYKIYLDGYDVHRQCGILYLAYYQSAAKPTTTEKNVYALQSYKSSTKQEIISCLGEGDELEFEEDDENIHICYIGDPIGKLPKKIAQKYFDQGAEAVYFHHTEEEETDYDFIEKPFVEIEW